MSKLTQIEKTARYIKRKGFTHIKVELEAQLNRHGEPCEDCDDGYYDCDHDTNCNNCRGTGSLCVYSGVAENDCDNSGHPTGDDECNPSECSECYGNGYYDCEEGHTCESCNGHGRMMSNMSEDYCKVAILNGVSKQAREALTFIRFYNDGSVDSECTFTIPVEKIEYLPEFVIAFKRLSDETKFMDVSAAGMHIAILRDGVYPVEGKDLNRAYLSNFINQMNKLMPALFFMASADHNSRLLHYRKPVVANDKYSAIHYMNGGMEYRVFQTCYDKPDMILQFIDVIAKTLKFYGTAEIRTPIFKQFKFPEAPSEKKAYLARFYETAEAMTALDKGLAYLKPDYLSIEQVKRQRHFKPKYDALYAEAKLRKEYIEYCSRIEAGNRERIERAMRQLIPSGSADIRKLYTIQLKPEALKAKRAEIARMSSEQPPTYQQWYANFTSTRQLRRDYTITA